MITTLKDIQRGFQALNKLAANELPARYIKIAYRLKRISEGAQKEFDASRVHLSKLLNEYGNAVTDESGNPTGAWEFTGDNQETFNALAEDFLSQQVELFGDPFTLSEIETLGDLVKLSAADLFALDWLIIDEAPEKAQGAGA